ncbi:MAG TPA: hypothetical protein VKZ86_07035 [Cyclobacteriaceae bacterium]|nr:hypothetical protein [Cyclobacteriaceae bacterium]
MTFPYRTTTFSSWYLSLVLILISSLNLVAGDQRPEFRGKYELMSRDGHVRLRWQAVGPNAIYELQQSDTPAFDNAETIYRGPDLATFISGLPDGVYYYRLRMNDGDWSEPLTLTVKHYSLQLALTLAGLGAIVFLLTVALVLKGTPKAIR